MSKHVLICVLCLSLIPIVAANADIAVTGGSNPQERLLKNVLAERIATRFQTSASVPVHLLTDKAMNAYIENGDDSQSNDAVDNSIDGIYEDTPSVITLRASSPQHELAMTFAHEYGHYVWQDLMTDDDRSAYRSIYSSQKAAHHLVTDYATESVEEGFAEAFSYFSLERTILAKRDPASLRFLDALNPTPSGDGAKQ